MTAPKKSLGQHWLKDPNFLNEIANEAGLNKSDTVLEIGPGLGTLTSRLLKRAKRVVAVELDEDLAKKLPGQFPGASLEVINQDILKFDLRTLPKNYVVVANVPYYITSKIIRMLTTAANKPRTIVLLVQKEVAERIAAEPGDMSILAVSAQLYSEVRLGAVVPAAFFTPPPKVDSQVVVLQIRPAPLISSSQEKEFFRIIKAGFSAKRKKLRSSLASGLQLPKTLIESALIGVGASADNRAEQLSLEQWIDLQRSLLPHLK